MSKSSLLWYEITYSSIVLGGLAIRIILLTQNYGTAPKPVVAIVRTDLKFDIKGLS